MSLSRSLAALFGEAISGLIATERRTHLQMVAAQRAHLAADALADREAEDEVSEPLTKYLTTDQWTAVVGGSEAFDVEALSRELHKSKVEQLGQYHSIEFFVRPNTPAAQPPAAEQSSRSDTPPSACEDRPTSELLGDCAGLLAMWASNGGWEFEPRPGFLAELRDRAAQFAAHGD